MTVHALIRSPDERGQINGQVFISHDPIFVDQRGKGAGTQPMQARSHLPNGEQTAPPQSGAWRWSK